MQPNVSGSQSTSSLEWDPIETPELLAGLETRGVRLWIEDNRLEVEAPGGVLNEADRIQLRERRWDIAAWLNGDHTTKIRRLSGGRVLWFPKRPPAKDRRLIVAIMDD